MHPDGVVQLEIIPLWPLCELLPCELQVSCDVDKLLFGLPFLAVDQDIPRVGDLPQHRVALDADRTRLAINDPHEGRTPGRRYRGSAPDVERDQRARRQRAAERKLVFAYARDLHACGFVGGVDQLGGGVKGRKGGGYGGDIAQEVR